MRRLFAHAPVAGALIAMTLGAGSSHAASVEFTLTSPTVSKELIDQLNAVVEKTDVQVDSDITLPDFVLARCGFMDPIFSAVLIEANKDVLRGDNPSNRASSIKAGTILSVPPCGTKPAIERTEATVERGDTGAALVRKSLGFDPARFQTMRACGERDTVWTNGGCPRAPIGLEVLPQEFSEPAVAPAANDPMLLGSADQIFTGLNATIADAMRIQIGHQVVVPTVAPTLYTFPVRGDVDAATAAQALSESAALPDDTAFATVEPYAPVSTIPASDPSNDCTPRKEEDWRREAFDLIDVLSFEKERSVMRQPGWVPFRPIVRLLDSGVHLEQSAPGWPLPFPGGSIDSTTVDGPGDVADIGPMPLGSRDFAAHGTQVAYVAVGGNTLARIMADQGFRISLRPFNIYMTEKRLIRDASGALVEVYEVLDGANRINSILSAGADETINMSFGRANRMANLKLGPLERPLYVVAAGNSQSASGEGNDIGILPLYPASSGGDEAANLISVASIDGDMTLSRFSNRSKQHVDIAAYGCRIATVLPTGRGFDRTQVSGTSFAAPQVTFAASLLRSLRPSTGARTKQRILAGGDYHAPLSDRIRHGRVLDLVKTVSLSRDVLEVRGEPGAPGRLVFGLLSKRLLPRDLCADPIPLNPGRRLIKAVFGLREDNDVLVDDPTKTLLVIADDVEGKMLSLVCQSKPATVEIVESDDGDRSTISTSVLKDITFRELN
jgi:hypothetical protein